MIDNLSLKRVNSDKSTLWESEFKTSFKVDLSRQREHQFDAEYETYFDIGTDSDPHRGF